VIVSSFVVGDCDDDSKTQRNEHLYSCANAASGTFAPEAAVLDRVVGSLDSWPVIGRLV
jgi:hypothetical protein